MARVVSWNVRGMNYPNKQEDLKILLQQHNAGLVGFLETKVKEQHIAQVIKKVCPRWQWTHNATADEKGRIVVCWHPKEYMFKQLKVIDQMIHGEAIQISTKIKFFITFVYGRNLMDQRCLLWEDINSLAILDDPWCMMGDFNAVLHPGERIGGVEVSDLETKDFAECVYSCSLQEFQYEGAFFTWTNKKVWSKIDRAFHNNLWYEVFSYTHVKLVPQSLSDHTPILVGFPSLPKPKSTFQFCEMWLKDREFNGIVIHPLEMTQEGSHLKRLQKVLYGLRGPLM